jgi:hypothetical protein
MLKDRLAALKVGRDIAQTACDRALSGTSPRRGLHRTRSPPRSRSSAALRARRPSASPNSARSWIGSKRTTPKSARSAARGPGTACHRRRHHSGRSAQFCSKWHPEENRTPDPRFGRRRSRSTLRLPANNIFYAKKYSLGTGFADWTSRRMRAISCERAPRAGRPGRQNAPRAIEPERGLNTKRI